jgi:chlorite dismutase
MLHINAWEATDIARAVSWLLHTPLGSRLRVTHSLTGLVRSSQYNPGHAPKESSPEAPHRYLTVYPFTKTEAWHQLPFEERRGMMKEHVDIGRKYSNTISQLLVYSFGIDDQEFIVSYQMDSLEDFQSLVMELRNTRGRLYTKSDTPIFTGVHTTLEEALDTL